MSTPRRYRSKRPGAGRYLICLITWSLASGLFSIAPSYATGSTIPVFNLDAANSSSFSYSGSTITSAITDSANSASGTNSGVTYDNSAPTPAFVFNGASSLSFGNVVKPDFTNGASIQMVAKFNSSTPQNSWPRIFDMSDPSGWNGLHNEFSLQWSQTGQLQVYMNRSNQSYLYTCGTTNSVYVANVFAMYSVQVGPGGICQISVDGVSQASSSNDSTQSYASHVPDNTATWGFNVGNMPSTGTSFLNGSIRSLTISSGTTAANSLTFMANSGTGYLATQTFTSSANIAANTLTRSGYIFNGWNTKSDGTGTSYYSGSAFPFSNSYMLFAQWSQNLAMSMPSVISATYRVSTPVTLTIGSSGSYTFYALGKKIPGCVNMTGTPPTLSCSWRPSYHGSTSVYAIGKISGSSYRSNLARADIQVRSSNR